MNKLKLTKEDINGILIGLYIYANALIVILPSINNILTILLLAIVIIYILNNRDLKIMKSSSAIIILLIIGWFFISYMIRHNLPNTTLIDYLIKFIFYGITSFIISYKNFSIKMVYQTISITSVLLIPYIIRNNFFDLRQIDAIDYQLLMTTAYRILPGILASIMCIIEKNIKISIKIVSIGILLIFGYTFINMAPRGAMLAVILFVLGICVYNKMQKKNIKNMFILFIIVVILIIIGTNIIQILYSVKDLLSDYNINFRMIDKTIYLLESDQDLTNGRSTIYEKAMEDVVKSPIIGNGIAAYEDKYNSGYIHNVFIQIAYEGGIVWLALYLIWCVIAIKKFFKVDSEHKQFIIFLIAIAMVQLLFSYYFWGSQRFWLLIAYMIQLNVKNDREEEN